MADSAKFDYQGMLVRYIRHVGMEEGSDFLDSRQGVASDVRWTDEEWSEMRELRLKAMVDEDFTTQD